MIVGDINSLHKPIDSCDPKKMLRRYEKENFNEIPHIKWYFCFLLLFKLDIDINSNCNRFDQFLVDGGGNFIDLFRHFYPERTQGELFFDLNSILSFIFTYIIFLKKSLHMLGNSNKCKRNKLWNKNRLYIN